MHPESRHAELMALALKHAIVGRDVSHLDLPRRRADAPGARDGARPRPGRDGSASPGIAPPADALARATERLRAARRPAVIVGHGAREQMDGVLRLAERLNAPVLTTFKGKGLVSDHHPLGCGVLGRSGTPIASWFMNEADLLLVMGASFSNHTGITPEAPDRAGRSRPHGARPLPPGRRARPGRHRRHGRPAPGGARGGRPPGGPPPRDRAALGHLARREGPAPARRPRPRAVGGGRLRRHDPPGARGCRDRRGRGQQHLLVRALLRVRPPVGADERLPGVDRLRLPGGDGGLGRGPRPADRRA